MLINAEDVCESIYVQFVESSIRIEGISKMCSYNKIYKYICKSMLEFSIMKINSFCDFFSVKVQ